MQFVDKDGKRVALEEFAVKLPEQREALTRSKTTWFMEDAQSLPTYSVAEVQAGFKAHPELLIRTEKLTAEKKKTVLSRQESEARLK